jgi:O-antigen/teichoic acid export membrane protein
MGADITAESTPVRATAARRIIHALSLAGDGELRRRLGIGFLWNIIAAVFNQGSTFALALIVANVLGRERFGMYALLQSTLLLVGNLAQLAMGLTTTKYVAEFRSSDKPRTARILTTCLSIAAVAGTAASVLAWAVASLIAERILGHAELAPLIRIGAPTIGCVTIGLVCAGALAGFENFRRIGVTGVVSGIIYIGTGAFAATQWGLRGVIAAIAISSAAQAAILLALVIAEAERQGARLSLRIFRESFQETPALMSFAFPAALAGITGVPMLWIVSAILARQPGGITEVAFFTAANSVRLIVLFVPYVVNAVGFSVLNHYRGADDDAGYRRAFWANMAVMTVTTLLAMIVLIIGSPLVLRAFGRGFLEARAALILLVAVTLPEAVCLALFQIVQTRGRMWTSLFFIALPRDLSIIVVALLLVPHYGAVGAALAFLTGAAVSLLTHSLLVRSLGISAR